MRFLHTSDWQIGKPFGFVDDETLAVLRAERLEVIARIGDFAISAKHRPYSSLATFMTVHIQGSICCSGPSSACVSFQMSSGTSSPATTTPTLPIPLGNACCVARCRPTLSSTSRLNPDHRDGSARVIPAILTHRHMSGDPTAAFESAVTPPGALRIGLAHGSVRSFGSTDYTTNNLLAADRAATARLDYLALGDWHGASRIDDAPGTRDTGAGWLRPWRHGRRRGAAGEGDSRNPAEGWNTY